MSGRFPKNLLGFALGFESWAPLRDSLWKAGQGFCTKVYLGGRLEAMVNPSEKIPMMESFLGVGKSRAGGYKLPEALGGHLQPASHLLLCARIGLTASYPLVLPSACFTGS